jgi:antagonist of KipI
MSVIFQKEGILTTVQDLGRFGFRRFGINPNGAMDKTAARLINVLLGNEENEAVLEMHFPAPEISFEENAVLALGGANFGAVLDGEKIENWKPFFARKGSVLSFKNKVFGNRAYFSVRGGFKLVKWLDSASTNLTAKIGGFSGRKLQKHDRLFFKQFIKEDFSPKKIKISNSLIPFYSRFPTVRITSGAEFDSLNALGEQNFLHEDFTITQNSDRMGFRLSGEPIYRIENRELVSSAVNFGTVQLLPDGQMIILMADHQTSGGYPRIANIIETDLPLAAQLGAGDKIAFYLISNEEAENIALDFEKDLNLLRIACKFSW